MRVRWWLVCVFLTVGSWASSAAPADDGFSPETMLFDEIPVIVSASRVEESLLDVAKPVSVITAEEIEASGATSIAELLETVPGLDVMRFSRTDVNMSARGFNADASTRLLVMIDGRSVYLDFFGVVQWEGLSVALTEIERIEVVLGPSSAAYGDNAFQGTVNIVTKRPSDLPSVHVWAGTGPDASFVDMTTARSFGRTALKASASYDVRSHFRNKESSALNGDHRRGETGLRSRLVNATLEHEFEGGGSLRLSSGMSKLRGDLYTAVGLFDYDGPEYYVQLNYDDGPWRLQSFMTHMSQSFMTHMSLPVETLPTGLPVPPVPLDDRIVSNTLDFEIQREIAFGNHEALIGLNTRRIVTDAPDILGDREAETLYAGFLQDRYRITDWLSALAAARIDEHPKAGVNVSPRFSLMLSPTETTRVWVAYSRSFRNPTQILNYLSLPIEGFAPTPTVLARLVGDEDLDPSRNTSYELGFQGYPHSRLSFRGNLFYEIVDDLTQIITVDPGPPVTQTFRNVGRMKAWGGELGLQFKLNDALHGFASYSFNQASGPYELVSPRQKASAGLRGRLGSRLRYALTGAYVSRTEFEPTNPSPTFPTFEIESRFQVDTFVGFQVVPQFELGFRARNVFHQVRPQYPVGDEIGSELLVTGRLEF
jgi:iron complex outermembrane receptor protein